MPKNKNEDKKIDTKNPYVTGRDEESYPIMANDSDGALQGYGSISSWENAKGRGFWGNSTRDIILMKK